MKITENHIATAILIGLAAIFILVGQHIETNPVIPPAKAAKAKVVKVQPKCAEDDPCFTWSKMGNHRRGIVDSGGVKQIVSPQRFCRLDLQGRIDWSVTAHLRGDRYAQTTCYDWAKEHNYA